MKLSEMKQILAERGIQLTRSLGQNFLHDANQLRRIVKIAELQKSDKILEIGPGLGPLTELLIEQAGEVLAIEKDKRFVEILRERFKAEAAPSIAPASLAGPKKRPATGPTPGLHLLHDDALDCLRRQPRDWSDWKLVANLPYSVASPILVELAQAQRGPSRIVATLQIEVAKRLMAQPGNADYGLLTLLVQLDYQPQGWFKIGASCFFPAPDVDSACICLLQRARPLLSPERKETYIRIVKRSFSQRRKRMFKLLKEDWPLRLLQEAFESERLSPQARAEEVSVERFVSLTLRLVTSSGAAQKNDEIFDVVDERDEVIGRETRSEVHRLGLKHRAVHVLVFNSRGQLFLQKRSRQKDRQPGLWDSSASGHLDSGEDYDACAVREVGEELGLPLKKTPRRLFKLAASAETDQEHVWVYRCEAEGPFYLHPEEIERGDWFTPSEIALWMAKRPEDFASALLLIWSRLKSEGEIR